MAERLAVEVGAGYDVDDIGVHVPAGVPPWVRVRQAWSSAEAGYDVVGGGGLGRDGDH